MDGLRANTLNVCECCEIQLQHKDNVGRKDSHSQIQLCFPPLTPTGDVRGNGRKRSGLIDQCMR